MSLSDKLHDMEAIAYKTLTLQILNEEYELLRRYEWFQRLPEDHKVDATKKVVTIMAARLNPGEDALTEEDIYYARFRAHKLLEEFYTDKERKGEGN